MDVSSLRSSRAEEKDELRGLNGRLEAYVARNRALEAQLKRGEGELAAASKHHAHQVTQLRSTFETQLGKVMDQLHAATSKADKEAEAHAATEHENASLKAKLAQQRELQKELDKMAAELAKARHQASAADSLQKDLAHLRSEVKTLHAERATLQGQLASLQGEAASAKAALASERDSSKGGFAAKVAQAKATWDRHHREKLAELEGQLRAEFEKEAADLRRREKTLREEAERARADLAKARSDSHAAQAYANELLKRVATQEGNHEEERKRWEAGRLASDAKLNKATTALAAKIDDFNRLMDVKIALQTEINHYRSLLEEEEERTGLPTPAKRPRSSTDSSGAGGHAHEEGAGEEDENPSGAASVGGSMEEGEEASDEEEEAAAAPASSARGKGAGARPTPASKARAPAAAAAGGRRSSRHAAELASARLAEQASVTGRKRGAAEALGVGAGAGGSSATRAAAPAAAPASVTRSSARVPALKFPPIAEGDGEAEEHEGAPSTRSAAGRASAAAEGSSARSHAGAGAGAGTPAFSADGEGGMDVVFDAAYTKVVVQNRTAHSLDLKGWSLHAEVSGNTFIFPAGRRIRPGDAITIWAGPEAKAHAVGPNNLLWSNEAVWSPDGDTAQLRDPAGRVVSSVHGHPTPRLPEGSAAKHLKFASGNEDKEGQCVIM